MRGVILTGLGMLLAGCHESSSKAIEVSLDTHFGNGVSVMTCKSSSTGTCHAIFISGAKTDRLSAATGKTATQSGVSAANVYCIDTDAPDPGTCHPQPLPNGQQILRRQQIEKH